jgi:Asp-tRNA(Asn)/Glu-tRNA(Gln) amidotransferase B subunit
MIIMNFIPIRKATLHEDPGCALHRTSQSYEQLNRYTTKATI